MSYYLILTLSAWFFISSQAQADLEPISEYLEKVKARAFENKILTLEKASSLVRNKQKLLSFAASGYLNGGYSRSDDTASSPFSSSLSKSRDLSSGIKKLWSSGFETSLDYTISDKFIGYAARSDLSYKKPTLALSLKSSLFQDLFSKRLDGQLFRFRESKKALDLEEKRKKKIVLVKSILKLSEMLELKDDLNLQKNLCIQIKGQLKKLNEKYEKRSVSKKDYLVSKKERNICQSNIKLISKQLLEKEKGLLVDFGITKIDVNNFSINYFFTEISSLYTQNRFDPSKVNFNDQNELLVLKSHLEIARKKNYEDQVLMRPELDMEIKVGMTGLSENTRTAHSQLLDRKYPFVYFGFTLQFPFSDDQATINQQESSIEKKILRHRYDQERLGNEERFKLLKESLQNDLSVFQNYTQNVQLSKEILKEARRDFNNGRIDFFSLAEFQKGLTQSQQRLAGIRTQIVAKTIEYIDYFNFFDGYF